MSKKILKALPEIYSFRCSDYGRFAVKGGASGLMQDNWSALGEHLRNAASKVGEGVNKTSSSSTQREARPSVFNESRGRERIESRTFGK